MRTPGSGLRPLAEINEEIANGVFGTNLKAMGFITYADETGANPDVVHFDKTSKVEELSPAQVRKIIADIDKLAQSFGYTIAYTRVYPGKKGDFHKQFTTIKVGVIA